MKPKPHVKKRPTATVRVEQPNENEVIKRLLDTIAECELGLHIHSPALVQVNYNLWLAARVKAGLGPMHFDWIRAAVYNVIREP